MDEGLTEVYLFVYRLYMNFELAHNFPHTGGVMLCINKINLVWSQIEDLNIKHLLTVAISLMMPWL